MVKCEKKEPSEIYLFFPTNEHGKVWCSVEKVQGYFQREIYTWTHVATVQWAFSTHHTLTHAHMPVRCTLISYWMKSRWPRKKVKEKILWLTHVGPSDLSKFMFFCSLITKMERILTSKCMKNIKTFAFKQSFALRMCELSVDAIYYVSYDDSKRAIRAHYKYKIMCSRTRTPKWKGLQYK